jgi:hypothetical protein
MKSRMKKMTSKWAVPLIGVALLIVLSTALAETAQDPVSGHGESVLNFVTGHASGSGILSIRGEELAASIEVQLLGYPVETEDGTLHGNVMHTFIFANGSITTNDKAVLDPVEGGFIMNERVTIISGTGDFANVSGKLTVHGQVMFTSQTMANVSYDIHGVISGY